MKINFISTNKVFISGIERQELNDKVMQNFVTEYPLFIGQATLFKDNGSAQITETIIRNYQRQYIYDVEGGKYRKFRYSNPLAWKDSKGKIVKC